MFLPNKKNKQVQRLTHIFRVKKRPPAQNILHCAQENQIDRKAQNPRFVYYSRVI